MTRGFQPLVLDTCVDGSMPRLLWTEDETEPCPVPSEGHADCPGLTWTPCNVQTHRSAVIGRPIVRGSFITTTQSKRNKEQRENERSTKERRVQGGVMDSRETAGRQRDAHLCRARTERSRTFLMALIQRPGSFSAFI